MQFHSITNLLRNLFFEKDFVIPELYKLSQSEKNTFTDYVSKCRIESFFLKQIDCNLVIESLGQKNYLKLKNNGKIRAIRTLENLRFAEKIKRELNARNISNIFLKGINMHKYYFQNEPAMRPISDIDILINKDDLIDVIGICDTLGFDVSRWSSMQKEGLELYRNPNPFHKNGQAQIDIHTSLKGAIFHDKYDFNEFAKYLIKKEINYCDVEDLFINCVIHGTRQSIYNVGPIFILDLMQFFSDTNINWKDVSRKIERYGLQREMSLILKYFENKIQYPCELEKFAKTVDFDHESLNLIFLSQPKNSSLFSIYTADGIKFLINKIFSKKYIKDHNFQKFTFVDFVKNILDLIKRHLLPLKSLNGEIIVSKIRFEILRKK